MTVIHYSVGIIYNCYDLGFKMTSVLQIILMALDIAWFIYTYRLTISEFPFKQKYPNVYKWYNLLYVRNEFYKEVKPPFIFYLVRKISLLKARLSKTAIHNFVS